MLRGWVFLSLRRGFVVKVRVAKSGKSLPSACAELGGPRGRSLAGQGKAKKGYARGAWWCGARLLMFWKHRDDHFRVGLWDFGIVGSWHYNWAEVGQLGGRNLRRGGVGGGWRVRESVGGGLSVHKATVA